jgi:hypothetical protein
MVKAKRTVTSLFIVVSVVSNVLNVGRFDSLESRKPSCCPTWFKILCLERRENDSAKASEFQSTEEACNLDECGQQHAWERWRICIYHLCMVYLKTPNVTNNIGEAFVQ